MLKKLLPLLSALLVIIMAPSVFYGAENQDMAADYVTQISNEISADIAKLRVSSENVLVGMKLESVDIIRRINELATLREKASDDMAAWGYTQEQREAHEHLLSELNLAYLAYGALLYAAENQSENQAATSGDISSLGNISSPDILTSDTLRQEISKVSRGLDVQVFYLQSKINKLRLDLAEASSLQKKLKEAQEGGEALELPHTHMLRLENARINVALSRYQVRVEKITFDANVRTIQRLRRRLADIQGKLSFSQELLDSQLTKLQSRIQVLTDEISNARKAFDSANSSLKKARASLGSADVNILTSATTSYMTRLGVHDFTAE